MTVTTDIYVKTHKLEPLKSFLGEILNCPLKQVDSSGSEMYSCNAVLGMQIQLVRNHPKTYYIDEIEGETIDYSELGFYIQLNPTREIFEISEMRDWQFNAAIAVGIMICRKLSLECLVMRQDSLVAKFVPDQEPLYYSTYYKCRHVFTVEELISMNNSIQ